MYYYSATQTDVEDILMDFSAYKKNKGHSDISIQSEPQAECGLTGFYSDKPLNEASTEASNLYSVKNINLDWFSTDRPEAVKEPENGLLFESPPDDEYDVSADSEAEYMRLMYTETNSKLCLYVDKVVCEYEYPGSSVFGNRFEKETIKEMVDKILDLASKEIIEIVDLKAEMHRHTWSPHRLLRACVESLLLNELFYKRKLMITGISDFPAEYCYI